MNHPEEVTEKCALCNEIWLVFYLSDSAAGRICRDCLPAWEKRQLTGACQMVVKLLGPEDRTKLMAEASAYTTCRDVLKELGLTDWRPPG